MYYIPTNKPVYYENGLDYLMDKLGIELNLNNRKNEFTATKKQMQQLENYRKHIIYIYIGTINGDPLYKVYSYNNIELMNLFSFPVVKKYELVKMPCSKEEYEQHLLIEENFKNV